MIKISGTNAVQCAVENAVAELEIGSRDKAYEKRYTTVVFATT